MAEAAKATTKADTKKHPGGRPTKLTRELVDKASGYVASCVQVVPTLEGLALYLDLHKDTIYAWEKETSPLAKEFSDVIRRIRDEQAVRVINGALYGRFNATISKLLLSKHGYVEKTEQDVKVEMPTPILGGLTREKAE